MEAEKRDFSAAAATWDENPGRVKLAKKIAEAIKRQVQLTPAMKMLDFGCGTGLVSLALQPHVGHVTGVDSSSGMLAVLRQKIDQAGLKNIEGRLVDLEQGDVLPGGYDLLVCTMALHHVQDILPLLRAFHAALVPGGILALSDLDLEDGRFHDDPTGVFHNGFDRNLLAGMLSASGFREPDHCTAAEIHKPVADGSKQRFTVFLMTGRKG